MVNRKASHAQHEQVPLYLKFGEQDQQNVTLCFTPISQEHELWAQAY